MDLKNGELTPAPVNPVNPVNPANSIQYTVAAGMVSRPLTKAQKCTTAVAAILKQHSIVRVNSTNSYYYRDPGESIYSPLPDRTLSNWARDNYLEAFGAAEPKDLRAVEEMTLRMVTAELPQLDNDLIYVGQSTYWSTDLGQLVKSPEKWCFRRLFATDFPDKHTVQIPPFTEEQDQRMWDVYNRTLDLLNITNGEPVEEPFSFVTTWANGDHDVYLDMVRSVAYCFVKKKPVGSYVLVGLRRNGKSAFAGMLHTIFGRNNTSMVRLSQLGDPHYVNEISTTLMNAPDEEDEKAIDAQATFKSISDHGLLTLSVMRENKPLKVNCQFMSFFPMNHVPEWKGTGAAACLKRTLVLPFYADLSEYDKKNYNFAEETFTPDLMCEFMGYILAFANYYSHHELKFSPTMQGEQLSLEEDQDSPLVYAKTFDKYFSGFSSLSLVYEDYCNWCRANDFYYKSRAEFKFVFRKYMVNRSSTKDPVTGRVEKVYHISGKKNLRGFMVQDRYYPEILMTTDLAHEKGVSVLYLLDEYYENKKTELSRKREQKKLDEAGGDGHFWEDD